MATIRDKLAAAIVARGGKLVSKTDKRWTYTHPRTEGHFYFIGPSGGLRTGKSITDSVGLTSSPVYERIRYEGSQLLSNKTKTPQTTQPQL